MPCRATFGVPLNGTLKAPDQGKTLSVIGHLIVRILPELGRV
jgi:hypothetical protein